MGTLEPVPDCAVVVGGELEQSREEEGRTGAASDIVKVTDWVQPFCSVGLTTQSHTIQCVSTVQLYNSSQLDHSSVSVELS